MITETDSTYTSTVVQTPEGWVVNWYEDDESAGNPDVMRVSEPLETEEEAEDLQSGIEDFKRRGAFLSLSEWGIDRLFGRGFFIAEGAFYASVIAERDLSEYGAIVKINTQMIQDFAENLGQEVKSLQTIRDALYVIALVINYAYEDGDLAGWIREYGCYIGMEPQEFAHAEELGLPEAPTPMDVAMAVGIS